eukprot:comp65850_c0_seq1/m.48005 comp65850_c0_seq1/g.48005  ORF comp65850_c0_seq1/g.48005 comp65850_c0_seq1/m.48005 type:complete len:269 (-) comp65850_c0_seq1:254-1060(-)
MACLLIKSVRITNTPVATLIFNKGGPVSALAQGVRAKHTARDALRGLGQVTSAEERAKQERKVERASTLASRYQDYKLRMESGEDVTTDKNSMFQDGLAQPSGIGMLAERRIQEALARGKLKNLAGEGKPLKEKQNVTHFGNVADAEMMSVLASAGAKPDFIERNNELKDRLPEVRQQIRHAVTQRVKTGQSVNASLIGKDLGEGAQPLDQIVIDTNDLIRKYNDALLRWSETVNSNRLVGVPMAQRPLLSIEKEVQKVLEELKPSGQ